MRATQVAAWANLHWIVVADLAVSDLPSAGEVAGAYLFRRRGINEVLYIGSTSSLLRRLFGNYIGGVGGATTKRIHALLASDGFANVEVAWVATPAYHTAEVESMDLYAAAHGGTRPRWNRVTRRLRSVEPAADLSSARSSTK